MSKTIYEVHYTKENISKKPPEKTLCNTNNNLAFTDKKNEVTCKKCLVILNRR